MRSPRFGSITASVIVTLAVSVSASAQGKSGKAPGKVNKTSAPPPSTSAMSTPTAPATGAQSGAASPFAWMDDASVIAPGTVWLGLSMVRWQGSGFGQTIAPVVDTAFGLTRRVQISASVPRVPGGLGTTFFSAKIAAVDDTDRGLKLALSPTLEVLSHNTMVAGQSRAQWGLPISVQLDRESGRFYASSGYFSPGIWYAGAGFAKAVTDRTGLSLSYSHAWATSPTAAGATPVNTLRRNEISGGGSFDLNPNVSLFGSLGRTIGVAAQDGAGTTLSFGVSLTAGPLTFE